MTFYVYVLHDPRKCGEPFYVGKGKGKRAWNHTRPGSASYKGVGKNQFKERVISAIREAGMEPVIDIIVDGLAEDDAFDLERELISTLGRRGIDDGGILTNRTAGGEGSTGLKFSAEARNRLSEARRGMELHANTRSAIRERNASLEWTDEMRKKVSAAHKGKTLTPEHRAKLVEAASRPQNPEHVGKRAAALRGKKKNFDDDTRAACAERAAKLRATGINNTPEARAKRSFTMRLRAAMKKAEQKHAEWDGVD